MASATLIPVAEYLAATFRPDRDYVDGELKERNFGERPHAAIQAILARLFGNHRLDWDILVLTEQRVQVNPTRYRIPDLCILRRSDPKDLIVTRAPLLWIEIVSREDSLNELQHRVHDYASMGVKHVWGVDPWLRIGYYASTRGFLQPEDGTLRIEDTPIRLTLAEVFAELDED